MNYLATNQLDKMIDRLRIARAEVPDLPHCIGLGGHRECPGYIGHKYEIPALTAITDDGEGHTFQLLLEKHAKYRAVCAGSPHPGSVGIENPDGIHGKPIDFMPMKCCSFALELGKRVGVLRHDRVTFGCRRRR